MDVVVISTILICFAARDVSMEKKMFGVCVYVGGTVKEMFARLSRRTRHLNEERSLRNVEMFFVSVMIVTSWIP